MSNWSKPTRHRAGIYLLVAAALQLIAGHTVFKRHLQGKAFAYYWLTCFVLTGLAMVVAWLEIRAVRRHAAAEQRELLERTLRQIEQDHRKKDGQG